VCATRFIVQGNTVLNTKLTCRQKKDDWIIPLLIAATLLTRLPVYRLLKYILPERLFTQRWSRKHQGLSVLWYPFIGVLLAAIIAGFIHLLPVLPPLLMAVFVVSLWVVLTGALHLDGVADAVDAAFAAHKLPRHNSISASAVLPDNALCDNTQALTRIFKDPTAGPMAVVALVLVLLLKVILLSAISHTLIWVLILTMVLSRAAALLLLLTTPYVSSEATSTSGGQIISRYLPKASVAVLLCAIALSVFFVLPITHAVLLMGVLGSLIVWWRGFWLKAMGGIVGDCIGALIEFSEVLVLLVLCLASL